MCEAAEEDEAPACRDDDAAIGIVGMYLGLTLTGCADPIMDGACVDPPVKELCPVTCGVCEAAEEAEEEEVEEVVVEEEEVVEAPGCRDNDAAIGIVGIFSGFTLTGTMPDFAGCADPTMDGQCVDPSVKELCPVTCGVCEAAEEDEAPGCRDDDAAIRIVGMRMGLTLTGCADPFVVGRSPTGGGALWMGHASIHR